MECLLLSTVHLFDIIKFVATHFSFLNTKMYFDVIIPSFPSTQGIPQKQLYLVLQNRSSKHSILKVLKCGFFVGLE